MFLLIQFKEDFPIQHSIFSMGMSRLALRLGATTNGLAQNIAGRQRTLIQRLAKGVLFLAQNVAMSKNMVAFQDTKILSDIRIL